MAVDPVCGMFVPERPESLQAAVRGRTYYFCSGGCLDEFTKPESELRKLKALTLLAALLTAPVLVLEWAYDLPGEVAGFEREAVVMFALATPVQFWAGWRFYRGASHAVRNRVANMDVLIATGTSAAWVYSTLNTFLPGRLPEGMYFEVAALIVTLILLGRLLEHAVKAKAGDAVRKLLALAPKRARLLRGGAEVEIPVERLRVGDRFVVRPGERIATDGAIVRGAAAVDESMVTGESVPVEKGQGDEVIGGTINTNGNLVVEARRTGQDTTLAQIAKLVEDAQTSAAPIQRLADVVSAWFVPAVVGIAVLAFVGWLLLDASFAKAFTSFIAVLIIACPCALGIATPAAIVAGTGKGAERGILVKGGQVLERAKHIDTVLFDKTGTLTVGKPQVTDVVAVDGDANELLRLVAGGEAGSEHPLARAVVEAAKERRIAVPHASGFQSVAGKGVKAQVEGRTVFVGTPAFLEEHGVRLGTHASALEALEAKGKTVLPVALDGAYAGAIALMDTLKPGAKEAVAALRAMGYDVWLITGDNEATGKAIAREVGIENVMARVLPADKARKVRELQRRGRHVAMVGDGVNDAPALATSDVGIALGSGTDVAVETGGIVLVRDDVRDVVAAVQLSRRTLTKIRQNLFWAFAYNAVLVPVAALGFFGENGPILAGAAMALSSVSVVSNALTLRLFKPRLDPARLRRVVTPSEAPRELPEVAPTKPKRGLPVMQAPGTGGSEMLFGRKKDNASGETATDPVCRMTVPTTTHRKVGHGGKTYYFCSDFCVEQFQAAPQEYGA